ncbi:two-component system regulatory protein [Leifsonia xyli subsp. cynodontis DSM 46306]|uniref:Response regulatory domain-containing protein n=1 Tax=Leifsonia xyli subsp. cynodontis DSM 46306 TaxID=1389489 RepID=U3PFB6_LEIXC|nr:response regulator [Leifsonia xyli]AGW42343.1 two-component system regulatory protein [Leifsonia xyli subsp. cynodontis DSM 46306]
MSTIPAPPPLAAPVSPTVRLAILDDHEILLDSLSTWIEKNAPEFDLVLRAGSWLELVHSDAFPTDLVIMDLQLRESISIGARVRTCRAAGAKVIVLTAVDTQEDRAAVLAAGAIAYVSKSQPMSGLLAAARSAVGWEASGGGSSVAASVAWRPASPALGAARPRLSDGERQALLLYADGRTTSEVAQAMSVQYETAKTYLRRVREKYGKAGRPTSSRADLIRRAAEDGYLT